MVFMIRKKVDHSSINQFTKADFSDQRDMFSPPIHCVCSYIFRPQSQQLIGQWICVGCFHEKTVFVQQ